MISDRLFGFTIVLLALAYIASAFQIETSFLSDPVGPKAFPVGIGCVSAVAGLYMVIRPDPDPAWPARATFGAIAIAVIALVVYAVSLKSFGFLLPTAVTATILSYQISPRPIAAIAAGISLSIGLFVIFKFALGLGLVALPKFLTGI